MKHKMEILLQKGLCVPIELRIKQAVFNAGFKGFFPTL